MTKKTTNTPNTGAPRLIDRKLEGPAQSLIRLADKGLRTIAAFLLGRISLKKYTAVEKEVREGYIENLGRLCDLGVERRWLSGGTQDGGAMPLPFARRGDDTAVTPYDTHVKTKAVGRSVLRLARGRCRDIALCARRRTPYNPRVTAEKKARDRYIHNMMRLWDLCNGSRAMPPVVWAGAAAHGQKNQPPPVFSHLEMSLKVARGCPSS
ncbi:MAG: hypothetical protein AAF471_02055 [Myxococcota bacterium]